jgi:predicted MPP superfamily phosphohydrolase
MRNAPFWWVFLAFMFLLDWYFFQVLRGLTSTTTVKTRFYIHTSYWLVSVFSLLMLVLLPYFFAKASSPALRNTLFALIAGLFFAKFIAAIFFLADDARRVVQWVGLKLFYAPEKTSASGEFMSRSAFLSWAGMLAGTGLFGALTYGMGNKYRYQVRKQRIGFKNLPANFSGLRVVHISDIHAGSFTDKEAVEKGVKKIMDLEPDLILFTGDLVNNMATEMKDYVEVFSQLRAPLGIYSVLGNHDYGDYLRWESLSAKEANLESLIQTHAQMGWKLLMNEHVEIEKDGEKIAILGIENWSAKGNFPKYGDLSKAYQGAAAYSFKLLMSHDPSHWKAQVVKDFKDIDLMLAGHTHGMQFGFEIPGLQWSPVQYVYNEWAGLYEEGEQRLYVNRGFGFLGYPGRVGILPEITFLELFSKD